MGHSFGYPKVIICIGYMSSNSKTLYVCFFFVIFETWLSCGLIKTKTAVIIMIMAYPFLEF